jgi:hypothetical protein
MGVKKIRFFFAQGQYDMDILRGIKGYPLTAVLPQPIDPANIVAQIKDTLYSVDIRVADDRIEIARDVFEQARATFKRSL